MSAITTVIIDDSKEFLELFGVIIKLFPELEIVQSFSHANKALRYIKEQPPELVLIDIELGKTSGLEVAKALRDMKVPFAFISAHEKYAIRASNLGALGFISKPVQPDHLNEVIHNWKLLYEEDNSPLPLDGNKETDEMGGPSANGQGVTVHPRRLLLPTVGNTLVIKLEQLMLIEAKSNYSMFTMYDENILISSKSLKYYAETLENHPDFLRIHRSYIVNKNFINSIIRSKQNRSYVVLQNNRQLEIVSQKKETIIKYLTL